MKKQILQLTFVAVFLGSLLAAGMCIFLLPQRKFSENENRYLAQLPSWNKSDICKGNMQKDLEEAVDDQFYQRDEWMALSTKLEKLWGKNLIHGVYMGKEGYYFQQELDSQLSEKRIDLNVQILERLKETVGEERFTALLVPSPGQVLKKQMPKWSVLYDAEGVKRKLKNNLGTSYLEVQASLEEADEEVYFHTDHHWNLYGAYVAYGQYAQKIGLPVDSYASFAPRLASDSFLGTLYSKVLESNPKKDDLYLVTALPKNLRVTVNKKHYKSIYQMKQLEKKDKYAVYFGGNYGYVSIENPKAKKKETLVIVKDSFAHSFVPFLIKDYQKIILLDLRYYNGPVSKILEDNSKSQVLFLMEMSNFAKEENLYKLLH